MTMPYKSTLMFPALLSLGSCALWAAPRVEANYFPQPGLPERIAQRKQAAAMIIDAVGHTAVDEVMGAFAGTGIKVVTSMQGLDVATIQRYKMQAAASGGESFDINEEDRRKLSAIDYMVFVGGSASPSLGYGYSRDSGERFQDCRVRVWWVHDGSLVAMATIVRPLNRGFSGAGPVLQQKLVELGLPGAVVVPLN